MDSMVYHYQSGTNQLTYVNDYADDGDYEDDINNQATGNYRYDKIGNLSKDIAEQIDTIFWNVYGKISEIRRFDTASRSDLTFEYDAAGQRVLKVVKPSRFENSWKSTWYVRDAQGNILATYDKKNLVIGDSNLLMEITNYILDNYDSAVFMQFIADAFYGNGNFKGALIETIADSSGSALVGEMYTLSRKLAWDSGLVRKYFKHFCALQGSTAESNLNDAMWDDDNSMRVILLDAIRDCGDSLEWTEALFTHDNTDAFLNWLDGATLSVMWFAAGFPGPPPPPAQMITDLSGLSASQLTPLILDVNGGTGWDIVLSYLENSAAESLLKAMSDPSTGFYSFCDLLNQISNCGETSGDLMGFVLNTGDTTWCDEVINDSTYAVYLLSLLANGDEKQFYKNAADLNPNWIVAALHRMGNFGVSDYLSKAYKYLGKPKYEDLLEAFADSLEFRQSLVLNELHMYGSSRLGMHRPERVLVDRSMSMDTSGQLVPVTGDTTVTLYAVEYKYFKRTLSYKQYELSNHLGNVLTTVLDRKTAVVDTNSTGDTVMYYIADVYTAQTYYAFGSSMPGYSYKADSADGYRFGFNGQEREMDGLSDYYSFEYRIHDARVGRFLSTDPKSKDYPWNSVYAFAENKVINGCDLEGIEWSSKYKWSDQITDQTHIDKLSEMGIYKEGMTYRDMWSEYSAIKLKQYEANKVIEDCADLVYKCLVDISYEFNLPIYLVGNRRENISTIYDNDDFKFSTKDELSEAIQESFSAGDLGAYYGTVHTVPVDKMDVAPGTILFWKNSESIIHHAATITEVTTITEKLCNIDWKEIIPCELQLSYDITSVLNKF